MKGHAPSIHEIDEPPVGPLDLAALDLARAPFDGAVLNLHDERRRRKPLAVEVLVDNLLEERLALGNLEASGSPLS